MLDFVMNEIERFRTKGQAVRGLLAGFPDFWQRELVGALHSIRVAHNHLMQPCEGKAVDGVFRLN